jgi:hypothetical protein
LSKLQKEKGKFPPFCRNGKRRKNRETTMTNEIDPRQQGESSKKRKLNPASVDNRTQKLLFEKYFCVRKRRFSFIIISGLRRRRRRGGGSRRRRSCRGGARSL